MPRDLHLGVDLGTSALKAVLVDGDGVVVASAERPLALEIPAPLGAEQDAEDWWRAAREAVREVVWGRADRVAAVGLAGQKHALLPLDARGAPLARAVLWCDGRAASDCDEVHLKVSRAALSRRAGATALPGYLLPKWLRFVRKSPERAVKTAHLVFAKDWLRYRMSGAFATDRTEASASLLYDVGKKAWAEDLARTFAVRPEWLPPVARSTDVASRVSAEGAAATGLLEGTPIVGGAGDNEAAAVAVGAIGEGRVAVTLGTSGTVIAHHDRRGASGGLAWGRHATRSGYAATGVVLSAGRAVDWVRRAAFPSDFGVEEMTQAAEASDPAEGPLVFLPSLVGERSPVADPGATGAFVGLRPGHSRGHLARAVFEGVAIAIAETVKRMRGAGVPTTELRITSGGARSPFWCGLVGAAAGLPVRAMGAEFGPAIGAALLAARGAGRFRSLVAASDAWVVPPPPAPPDPREVERLRSLASAFVAAANALRGVGGSGSRRARRGEGSTSS